MGDKNIQKKSPKTAKKEKQAADKKTKINEATQKTQEQPTPAAQPQLTVTKSTDSPAGKVIRCECRHEFQDSRYGTGMRVHTPKKTGGWRCTVCGKEH